MIDLVAWVTQASLNLYLFVQKSTLHHIIHYKSLWWDNLIVIWDKGSCLFDEFALNVPWSGGRAAQGSGRDFIYSSCILYVPKFHVQRLFAIHLLDHSLSLDLSPLSVDECLHPNGPYWDWTSLRARMIIIHGLRCCKATSACNWGA